MMKLTVAVMGLLFVGVPVIVQEKNQIPNLSGTWVLDKTRSDPLRDRNGRPTPNAEQMLVIHHQEPVLKIKNITRTERGEQAQDLEYTTDGRENTNTGPGGAKVTSRTQWEKGKLVTRSSPRVAGPLGTVEVKLTQARLLSPDGKTLTVEVTLVVPIMGDTKSTHIYAKKQ